MGREGVGDAVAVKDGKGGEVLDAGRGAEGQGGGFGLAGAVLGVGHAAFDLGKAGGGALTFGVEFGGGFGVGVGCKDVDFGKFLSEIAPEGVALCGGEGAEFRVGEAFGFEGLAAFAAGFGGPGGLFAAGACGGFGDEIDFGDGAFAEFDLAAVEEETFEVAHFDAAVGGAEGVENGEAVVTDADVRGGFSGQRWKGKAEGNEQDKRFHGGIPFIQSTPEAGINQREWLVRVSMGVSPNG